MAININPKNKGKWTARHEPITQGLNSPNLTVRKEANFARMAKRRFKPLRSKKAPQRTYR